MTAAFLLRRSQDVLLRVRLTPNARSEAFGDCFTDASGLVWLRAAVRAVPEKGRANEALLALIAGTSGIAKSRLSLHQGETARTKTILVRDCSPREEELLAGLRSAGATGAQPI